MQKNLREKSKRNQREKIQKNLRENERGSSSGAEGSNKHHRLEKKKREKK